ncbi:Uncharacterised protein [Acinetobacter baumannii]|nr:Uncharacterised protein [Acinetobacter baumannii]
MYVGTIYCYKKLGLSTLAGCTLEQFIVIKKLGLSTLAGCTLEQFIVIKN